MSTKPKISKGSIDIMFGDTIYCDGDRIVCIEQNPNTEGNTHLIADAFNTTNKSGLLPSELLKQRDELLEALIEARQFIYEMNPIKDMYPIEKMDENAEVNGTWWKIKQAIKSTE